MYIGGHGDFRNIANVKFYFHSYTPGICINKRGIEIMSQTGIYENYNLLSIFTLIIRKFPEKIVY